MAGALHLVAVMDWYSRDALAWQLTETVVRNVKYEEVYLKDYSSYREAEESLREYLWTYNHERLHENLGYQTPAEVYFGKNTIQPATLNISQVETRSPIR